MGLEETIRTFGDRIEAASIQTSATMEAINRMLDRLALAVEMTVPTLERLMQKMDETRTESQPFEASSEMEQQAARNNLLSKACETAVDELRIRCAYTPESPVYRQLVDALEGAYDPSFKPQWLSALMFDVAAWRLVNPEPKPAAADDSDVPF